MNKTVSLSTLLKTSLHLFFNNGRTFWSYPAIWAYYSLGEADLSGESDESKL